MIYIGNIREVMRDDYDPTFAIVRSYKGKQTWIKQLDALSPSWDLFKKYRQLLDNGEWNLENFQKVYLPQFLREMHEPIARDSLNTIFKMSKSGINLALVCFCQDERLCHRSIIAGLLQGAGADVRLSSGADYSCYYKMYKGE